MMVNERSADDRCKIVREKEGDTHLKCVREDLTGPRREATNARVAVSSRNGGWKHGCERMGFLVKSHRTTVSDDKRTKCGDLQRHPFEGSTTCKIEAKDRQRGGRFGPHSTDRQAAALLVEQVETLESLVKGEVRERARVAFVWR